MIYLFIFVIFNIFLCYSYFKHLTQIFELKVFLPISFNSYFFRNIIQTINSHIAWQWDTWIIGVCSKKQNKTKQIKNKQTSQPHPKKQTNKKQQQQQQKPSNVRHMPRSIISTPHIHMYYLFIFILFFKAKLSSYTENL